MSIKSTNRTIVNSLGIPGILALLWYGEEPFAIFISLVIILATREFLILTKVDLQSNVKWIGYLGGLGFCYFYHFLPSIDLYHISLLLVILIITGFFIEMIQQSKKVGKNLGLTFLSIFYVGALLSSLIALRNYDSTNGSYFTITMVLSIWSCDSAAFYFGTKWGRKKILPTISPNKSWVGCVAGLTSSVIIFYFAKHFSILDLKLIDVCILSIISGVFGQAGDFAESLLKRNADVKDSGTLLLGHGGVLDRFDSLIFASPLTFYYVHFIL